MKQLMPIAMRLLWREWRSGELNLLTIALVVAVASMTSVAFVTNRVASALEHQAGDLIAADLIVSSSEPADPRWATEARQRQITIANTVQFPSVVLAGDDSNLASVKAVDDHYPLRGTLKTDDQPFTAGVVTQDIPEIGQVWIDSRLFNALQLSLGQQIELGAARFTVSRILSFEPDYGGDMFSAAPRVLLNRADLEKTQLIVAGSRVQYRQLYAASRTDIDNFKDWLASHLRPGDSIQGIREARPELRTALERADSFLGLTALVAVLLSAVAIAIAAQRYAQRHRNSSALMRSFGAQQSTILNLFILQLGVLGVIASVLGVVSGYLSHTLLINWFSALIPQDLPPVDLISALPGFCGGILLIYSFALPPLYQLKNTPPIQVLRPAAIVSYGQLPVLYAGAALVTLTLVLWQAKDFKLAMIYLAGLLIAFTVLGFSANLLLRIIEKFKPHANIIWRIGLTYLTRRRFNTMVESIGFGIGMMVIIVLVLVRTDLMNDWLVSLPEDTPNQFVINIQQDQKEAIKTFFASENKGTPQFYPMVRARLTAINGREVTESSYDDPRAKRLSTRVFNLSWVKDLPADNKVIAGQWWDEKSSQDPQFSFDQGLAEQLNIKIGDTISYYVAGQTINAPVTSLREVNWDTFQPNFFVVSPPATLSSLPSTYISSFYVAVDDKAFLNRLIREFRNLTLIDVELMIGQVRSIMDQVTQVIEFVFLFTIAAGLLVMFATMQSTHDERIRDNAIMKTLGATRVQLRKILLVEFLFVGLMSSIVATLAANLTGFGIAHWLMNLNYQFHIQSVVISIVVGTAAITLTGLLAFRQYHKMTPASTLRHMNN